MMRAIEYFMAYSMELSSNQLINAQYTRVIGAIVTRDKNEIKILIA